MSISLGITPVPRRRELATPDPRTLGLGGLFLIHVVTAVLPVRQRKAKSDNSLPEILSGRRAGG